MIRILCHLVQEKKKREGKEQCVGGERPPSLLISRYLLTLFLLRKKKKGGKGGRKFPAFDAHRFSAGNTLPLTKPNRILIRMGRRERKEKKDRSHESENLLCASSDCRILSCQKGEGEREGKRKEEEESKHCSQNKPPPALS